MNQIPPHSTIGIFGSGQLGRMFTLEARKMGYRLHTFSPSTDSPTGQAADLEIVSRYGDLDAVRDFAKKVNVITFEFENIPFTTVEAAAEFADVRPSGEVLFTTQNRLREKTFLADNGIPITPYRSVRTLSDLEDAVDRIGLPAILKTAGFGYDGKGQQKIHDREQMPDAIIALNGNEAVLEGFVDFEKEVSVVLARWADGRMVNYGVIENDHANHILDVSFAPAVLSEKLFAECIDIAETIAEKFEYVGTMCVEFFVTKDEKVLVNEIAPRPHNSGHLTFGPCVASQFEQQVRAVCGLPPGSTAFYKPAAMANLLGDIWAKGEPNWAAALSDPSVKLHLYGKADPRPGRKMGHLTAVADTAAEAVSAVRSARERLLSETK